MLPDDRSADNLPITTMRRLNGDEIQITAGKQCVIVAFLGADVLPATGPDTFTHRFNAIHADLRKYLASLPQPHPVILEDRAPPVGTCPIF